MHHFWSRPWRGRDDTRRMQALARDRLERAWPAPRIHPGDLDWWVVQAHGRAPGIEERLRLWFAGDPDPAAPLAAYAWFGLPGELDAQVASDDPVEVELLTRDIVAWADERRSTLATGEPGPLTAWAAPGEPMTDVLLGMGLEPGPGHGYVIFTGELPASAPGPTALPDGIEIRPLAGDADVASRVACGRAAFTTSTMTEERYRTTFDAWLYRHELDLLAVEPDGWVVAFALGWLDPSTGVVELEPVGVHPDRHRQGLGREICRATLERAAALGARRAFIAAERDNRASTGLYASLGLTVGAEVVGFSRPLGAEAAPAPGIERPSTADIAEAA